MMTNLLGYLFFSLAVLCLSPLILITWIESWLTRGRSERIFGSCKELLAAVPTYIGLLLRGAFYTATCRSVARGTHFLYGSMVAHRGTTIGRGSIVGCYTLIGFADIGERVIIGSRASILSGRYQHGRPAERNGSGEDDGEYSQVKVGNDTWIGEGALVMADVGHHVVVGAGSVVYKEVPDNVTVLGNPARRVSL